MKTTKKDKPAVFFGGGSGASAVLQFARSFWPDLTSIHGVFDNGGSSAELRKRGHVAFGDLRRGILALATRTEQNAVWYDLVRGRFPKRVHGMRYNNDSIGNFMLAFLSESNNMDPVRAIRLIEEGLGNTARVLPISLDSANVHCFGSSGRAVPHQGHISGCAGSGQVIMSASLIPLAHLYQGAREAILNAGKEKGIFVVTGGSLFDSVLAPLSVEGMAETLAEFVSLGGRIVQIVNPMNQPHQSPGFSSTKHIDLLLMYIRQESIYAAIVNTGTIPSDILEKNLKIDGSSPVSYEKTRLAKHNITGDFVEWDEKTGKISQNEAAVKAIHNLA